ncbi:MAG: hypothetical protein AAGI11_22870 [Pseudomonadota bacterium]
MGSRSGLSLVPWDPARFPDLGIGGVLSVNDSESVHEDEIFPHERTSARPLACRLPVTRRHSLAVLSSV